MQSPQRVQRSVNSLSATAQGGRKAAGLGVLLILARKKLRRALSNLFPNTLIQCGGILVLRALAFLDVS